MDGFRCYLCNQENPNITVRIIVSPEMEKYAMFHEDCMDEFLFTLVVSGGYKIKDEKEASDDEI